MDKEEKTQYQDTLEKYIENKQIYDFFENLLRKLLIVRPDDPYEYLISHLSKKKQNFVISLLNIADDNLGSASELAAKYNLVILSRDALIEQELQSNSDLAPRIKAARDKNIQSN